MPEQKVVVEVRECHYSPRIFYVTPWTSCLLVIIESKWAGMEINKTGNF